MPIRREFKYLKKEKHFIFVNFSSQICFVNCFFSCDCHAMFLCSCDCHAMFLCSCGCHAVFLCCSGYHAVVLCCVSLRRKSCVTIIWKSSKCRRFNFNYPVHCVTYFYPKKYGRCVIYSRQRAKGYVKCVG